MRHVTASREPRSTVRRNCDRVRVKIAERHDLKATDRADAQSARRGARTSRPRRRGSPPSSRRRDASASRAGLALRGAFEGRLGRGPPGPLVARSHLLDLVLTLPPRRADRNATTGSLRERTPAPAVRRYHRLRREPGVVTWGYTAIPPRTSAAAAPRPARRTKRQRSGSRAAYPTAGDDGQGMTGPLRSQVPKLV
jgi:hypothetical protein